MDKVKYALSVLSRNVFTQFVQRGGVVTNNGSEVNTLAMSSQSGLLPALVWVASIFYKDHKIPFPDVTYRRDSNASLGYVIDSITLPGSSSTFLLLVSDFLSEEVFPMHVVELDVGRTAADFQEWCRENAMTGPTIVMQGLRSLDDNP